MDKETRNKIKKMVLDARKELQREIGELLEGVFGLHRDGTIEDISRLPQIRNDQNAIKAREGFAYFIERETAAGSKKHDAVERLILGLTFTHLNRLVALKLMERRKVIRETVSRGSKSNGFVHYVVDVLKKTDLSQLDDIDIAYQGYILYQCREVAEEIKVLFDPEDLSSFVFPRPRALKAVLEVINNPEIDTLWDFDETIGWFYQYFTPKELREQARAESSAPRNSWELAFRNQFYTPRYVVQFLADNTLGRIWYEMMQGNTMLSKYCEYMVKPKNEIFLRKDENPSAQTENFQVPFREKKDPRLLKILDPACGSGHFLLYIFDLLMIIYREAYGDKDLGIALQKDYPDKDAFEREIPRLILENNLYGIDIDLRAIQIAALALWLRAQREWMTIRREDRPRVRNAHLVCAEPMPGNQKLFEDFVSTLKPALLGDLVRNVWDKMKLAGEAGPLLQIEQELKTALQEAKQKWKSPLRPAQTPLFGKPKLRQLSLSLSEIIKDDDFFKEAEERVFSALRDYAEKVRVENHGYGRRLFAEESIRGFQFIEVLQNRFDVVLMNPPFGETSPDTKSLLGKYYPEWNRNVLCAFVHRMLDLTIEDGSVGVIFDRTAIVKSTYEDFRKKILIGRNAIFNMADTGWEVLDANVETTTMIFQKNLQPIKHHPAFFFDVRNINSDEKGNRLKEQIETTNNEEIKEDIYIAYPDEFEKLPNSVIGYDIPEFAVIIFNKLKRFDNSTGKAGRCLELSATLFYKNFWEVDSSGIGTTDNYCLIYNGGSFFYYFMPIQQISYWHNNTSNLRRFPNCSISNINHLFKENLCYGKRGEFLDAHILEKGRAATSEGLGIFLKKQSNKWFVLSLANSSLLQYLINLYSGIQKREGYFSALPIALNDTNSVSKLSCRGYYFKSVWYLGDETNYQFEKPWIILWKEKDDNYSVVNDILDVLIDYEKKADKELEMISSEIDSKTLELYGVTDPEDIAVVEKAVARRPKDVLWKETRGYSEGQKKIYHVESLLSFWIGCLFGRWDAVNGSFYDEGLIEGGEIYDLREAIRKKADELWEKDEIIAEPTKFALLKEEIASRPKVKYPYAIDTDGIIPLDEGHSEDLIKQIEIAAEITFGSGHVEQVIKEIEGILGQDLRTYFTKRFFGFHANRYLRKPIYWLLQSPNKTYSIYVYYHKIDRDTLLKIIRNYVEPKINLLVDESKDIKTKTESSEGAEKRRLEKRQAELLDVMLDIINFRDSINKLAAKGVELNIDDGIAVNIAPFKDIITWNEVQKYWSNLESGECDWSKLAMKYWPERVKAKCKKDKSLAITHGCE